MTSVPKQFDSQKTRDEMFPINAQFHVKMGQFLSSYFHFVDYHTKTNISFVGDFLHGEFDFCDDMKNGINYKRT